MFASVIHSFVVAALTINPRTTRASPTPRTPQIGCNSFDAQANYLYLSHSGGTEFALPGFNSTYRLSDALKAIGSTSGAGDNPEVLQNLGPFSGDNFKL
jgi:hypothetical protein